MEGFFGVIFMTVVSVVKYYNVIVIYRVFSVHIYSDNYILALIFLLLLFFVDHVLVLGLTTSFSMC